MNVSPAYQPVPTTEHTRDSTESIIPLDDDMGSLFSKPFDPTYRYATSWILPPAALFFIRALLSLYAFVTILFVIGWDGTHFGTAGQTFSYFTHLTYWGLAFYNA